MDHRPQAPVQLTGEVVPLNVHGTTVYLTRIEYVVSEYSLFIGIFSGIAGGAVLQGIKKGAPK